MPFPFRDKVEKVKINNKPFTFTPGEDGSLIADDHEIKAPQLYQGPVSQSKVVPGGTNPADASYLNTIRKKRAKAVPPTAASRG